MAYVRPSSYHGQKLALKLKAARERSGFTQSEVSDHLRMTVQKISRIEVGQRPNYYEMMAMLEMYGVSDKSYYTDLLDKANDQHWWVDYRLEEDTRQIQMEHAASSKNEYQLGYVPDLLQTEQYARALLSSPGWSSTADEIDTLVRVRMQRQARLQGDTPLSLHVVMHESILDQELVDHTQVRHLIDASRRGNVTLQIIPVTTGVHVGLQGSFAAFSFAGNKLPEFAYLDSPIGQTETHKERSLLRLTGVFDELQSIALSPRNTVALLNSRLKSRRALEVVT